MFFRVRNSMNPVRYVLAAFMVFLLCGMAMAQQETGQISGTIKDPSGAVVPDVAVQVRSVATSQERTATTSGSGSYTVTNLLPGNYSVTVSKAGFTRPRCRSRSMSAASQPRTSPLRSARPPRPSRVVGGAVEQVNVETQVLMDVVNDEAGRESSDPDAQSVRSCGHRRQRRSGRSRRHDRGTGYSINGQRSASTNMLLDGSDNNDSFTATVGQSVPLDSVQEFSVVSSSFTAEYGRASGGVINVATKSGSNSFHGSPTSSTASPRSRPTVLTTTPMKSERGLYAQPVRVLDRRSDRQGQAILLQQYRMVPRPERVDHNRACTDLAADSRIRSGDAGFLQAYGTLKSGLILGKPIQG